MDQLDLFRSAEVPTRPLEEWEAGKNVPGWLRMAARTLHRWPSGRELTESEFDEGVRAASQMTFR